METSIKISRSFPLKKSRELTKKFAKERLLLNQAFVRATGKCPKCWTCLLGENIPITDEKTGAVTCLHCK